MTPDLRVVENNAQQALEEDAAFTDATASLIPNDPARARIVCRDRAVLCGQPWADAVFRILDLSIHADWHRSDGDETQPGEVVATLEGPAKPLLSAERCALNFLQLLSGVATRTRDCVSRLGDGDCVLLDTRKTLPGLRHAQKYAVTIGGATAHRASLADAILFKENHWALLDDPADAIARARERHPGLAVIVEVENLEQLRAVYAARPDVILLDNMAPGEVAEATRICPDLPLEASGSIAPEELRAYADSGAARLSLGSLTKNVEAVDFSMSMERI